MKQWLICVIILLVLSGCKLEKTIIVKKEVHDQQLNSKLNDPEIRKRSGSTLKCECLNCLDNEIVVENIRFNENGDVERIGPFDATAGSACEFEADIHYGYLHRINTSRFILNADEVQVITLKIR